MDTYKKEKYRLLYEQIKAMVEVESDTWHSSRNSGEYRGRTDDLLHAMQAL